MDINTQNIPPVSTSNPVLTREKILPVKSEFEVIRGSFNRDTEGIYFEG